MNDPRDEYFMNLALTEARQAFREGEIPVGAVITDGINILAKAHNMTERLNDVTAHAEMLALTAASEAIGGKYLPQCTIYVTVEPCAMCAGALGWSQIGRLVYGAPDIKRGFLKFCSSFSMLHPNTIVTSGVLADEASELMKSFFKDKR